jgi:hypothetical protein
MVETEPSSIGRLKFSKQWSKQISKWQAKTYCDPIWWLKISSNDQFFCREWLKNENSQLPNLVTKRLGDTNFQLRKLIWPKKFSC